jgi:hypothetical protein
MREVEQLIYARMTNDTEPVNGLLALLGDTTHILHAYQNIEAELPYLTFHVYSVNKGTLGGDFTRSLDVFVQFNAFGPNYADVLNRVRRLFDGYRFDIPNGYTDVGQLKGVFDFEGPDGYDEQLEVQTKQVRYRFFVTPMTWAPITA